MNGIIVELSKRPWIRVWRNETGAYPVYRKDNEGGIFLGSNGQPVVESYRHYGLPGSSDIIGLAETIHGVAIFVAIECKTGTGRMSERQENFGKMIRSLGGLHIEARTVEGTVRAVEEFICRR